MSESAPTLGIASAPFLKSGLSTRALMLEVLLSLVLVLAAATWFFGVAALLVVLAATAGAVGTEWLFMTERRGLASLRDGSALVTGVLLGLTLPPAMGKSHRKS